MPPFYRENTTGWMTYTVPITIFLFFCDFTVLTTFAIYYGIKILRAIVILNLSQPITEFLMISF